MNSYAIEQLRKENTALRAFAQDALATEVDGRMNSALIRAAERHGLMRWDSDAGVYIETPLLDGETRI